MTAADFHPITLPPGPSLEPIAEARPGQLDALAPIPDFSTPSRTFAPRATPKQPTVTRTQSKAPAQPAWRSTGHSATGTATWYCKAGISVCHHDYPGGMYAAAGPELRVGDWRGRVVHVCGNGRCVNVRLIDWCACGGDHIIDLYSDAFTRLAPLSAGGIRVKVSW